VGQDLRQELSAMADAIAHAARNNYRPLRSTAAFVRNAIGGEAVAFVAANVEPVGGGWSVTGDLVVFGQTVVAFVHLDSSPSSAHAGTQQEGALRVQVLPRSALSGVEVTWEKHGVQSLEEEEYFSFPYEATLILAFAGRESAVEIPRLGTSSLTTELYASLLADLRAS